MVNKHVFLAIFLLSAFSFHSDNQHVFAQEILDTNKDQVVELLATEIQDPIPNLEDRENQRLQLNNPLIDPADIPSLFLTPNEENLISDAVEGFLTRPPTEDEVEREQRQAQRDKPSRPSSVREIGLGGILYTSDSDWTIWLNSQKITPSNIPPAIMDVQVFNDYIKLKWLDFQTNQIFPVKLRPHQRFNFDSRMFLPGASSSQNN